MSKIIVTGALGFVGANIAETLATKHEVLIVDDLNNQKKERNLRRLNKLNLVGRFEFINKLEKFKNFDVIVHAGACSDTTNYDEKYMIENNFEYSKTLIDFSTTNNINFIFSSSASVYGLGLNGFNVDPNCENPLNIYAKSKLMVDNYIRKILNSQVNIQSRILSLRYFNIYGERMNLDGAYCLVMGIFAKQMIEGNPLTIVNDGEQRRDFTYVGDAVNANILAARHSDKLGGDVFNIGNGKNYSVNEVADMMGGEKTYTIKRREPFETLADNKKAYSKLGWAPKGDLPSWIKTYKEKLGL